MTFIDKGKRFLVILPVLAVLLVSMPYNAFSAQSPANLDIAVKAGYDDIARVGSTVPFRISLVNKGNEISGEVQLLITTNPDQKTAYAMPFNLPKGSAKEIIMNVPVSTADKKVEVRLVNGSKTLETGNYEFKKLIAPETPVIGVLTDDPDAFRALNSIKITQNADPNMVNEINMKMAAGAIISETTQALPDMPAEVIPVDAVTMPGDIKAMNGFDIFIISNFDTSSLSAKQTETLDEWVKSGRTLFIGTGANWRKVYGGLKDEVKPFAISETVSVPFPKAIGTFTGKSIPSGSLDVAEGDAGKGGIILEESGLPLAAAYKYGKGVTILLSFDPSLSPVADWTDVQTLWKNLILAANNTIASDQGAQPYTYPGYGRPYMDFQYLTSNVPETQSPPFVLLLVLVGVYILVIGPALYLILKWKDKRDFSWLLIPAAAFLFMGIIYVAGYRTRYTTAVLNNVSLINLDTDKKTADINTWMGAFNNGRGNMKIEYAKNLSLEVNGSYYYDNYPVNAYPQENANAMVTGKLTFTDPPSWDLYNVRLWEPRYMFTSKSNLVKGFTIDPISIDNGRFSAVVRNGTGYDLRESFIVVGSSFIDVGSIAPGEEKKLEVELDSPTVKKRFEDFLDSRYGQPYYGGTQQKPTADWQEKQRKRNILENITRNMVFNNQNGTKIMFFALNYDDMGYDIIINGKAPAKFNTNIVYSAVPMNFEKGKHMQIPEGIFKPVLDNTKNAYLEDPLVGGVRINTDGDVDFNFTLPDNINIDKIRIICSTFLPGYVKYSPQPVKGQQQPNTAKNTYRYYVFNCKTSQWEEIKQDFTIETDVYNYINNKSILKFRINAVLDKNGAQEELLGVPGLEISGVVK